MFRVVTGVALYLGICAIPIFAHAAGADFGLTGPDDGADCTACHGTGVNVTPGNVKIVFPNASWTAGQTYHMQVIITDATARRWGFELAARLSSDPTHKQEGTLVPTDSNTQIVKPSPTSTYQEITHTLSGTRPGTAGPTTFAFDWTAPAAGTGDVTFFVMANAANNNNQPDPGDHIYGTTLQVSEASAVQAPTLRATQPVVTSFLANQSLGFASNAYLELYGDNLYGGTPRTWAAADFNGPNAPIALDDVRVQVNGKDAFIYYISPTQININTPDDPATGPVQIQVFRNGVASNAVMFNKNTVAPALLTTPAFNIGGKQYVVALTPTSTSAGPFIGETGLIAGVSWAQVKPGDTIILYALGCGPTDPASPAGVAVSMGAQVSSPYTLRIGGVDAQVDYFGTVAGTIGLYQINARVPSLSPGDASIELVVNGVSNGQQLSLSGVVN